MHDALSRNPDFLPARRMLAVIYAELGREKEARAEVARDPAHQPGRFAGALERKDPYKNQADLDRFIRACKRRG